MVVLCRAILTYCWFSLARSIYDLGNGVLKVGGLPIFEEVLGNVGVKSYIDDCKSIKLVQDVES